MNVSIIIPAYNEERLLPETLRTVRNAAEAFTRHGWEHEVIVCDNNSTDSTAAVAAAAGARVVFEPVNQIGRARNAGAFAATGEWLLFIDADTPPSHRLFARTRAVMASGRHLGGGARIRWQTGVAWAIVAAELWNCTSALLHWAAGSYLFARADVFREIGGFSDDLFVSEELDLSLRLNRAARRRKLLPLHIIDDPGVDTSDRKLHLYSGRELMGFALRSIMFPGRVLRRADQCHIWYDGRR